VALREGLAEYYRVNPGLSEPAFLDHKPSATFFHRHDCTHVIFGTHTGPLDEGVNDILTLFGVKINYYGYIKGFLGTTEVKSIAKSYASVSMIARLLWQTLKLTPKIRRTAKAMHKKWPWDPPEGSLDRPLAELRQEYGIILFRPETELGLDPATV